MEVNIIPIGNSKGVRIPKAMLEQCGFGDKAELTVREGALVIEPRRKLREGWEERFRHMAANGDDALEDNYVPSEFDKNEWEW